MLTIQCNDDDDDIRFRGVLDSASPDGSVTQLGLVLGLDVN